MPTKQKGPKPSKKNAPASMAQIEKEQRKEQRMIADMTKREQLMKWLLIGVVILLLLLILFAGYATDWLKGLSKDSTSGDSGVSSSQDAASGTGGTGTTGTGTNTGTSSTGGTGTTGTGTNTGTSSTGGTTGTTSNTGSTSRSSDTSATKDTTTTNNTSTTTTNNNTTTPTVNPGLLSLYTDTSVGDTISSLLDSTSSLAGVSKNCRTEVLIQVCDFSDGNATVTTKNLLGTGIITSITKDF